MDADGSYSFEKFAIHARGVALRFEQRRMQFLRKLKLRSAIALLLLVTFPVWYAEMESFDNIDGGTFSALWWGALHVIAGIVIVGLIIAYGVMPLFRYRHYTTQIGSSLPGVSGVAQQRVSLKGEIFGQLLQYFGQFSLYEDRRISLKAFHHAPDLPEFDEMASEDYIRGSMDGVTVELTEAKLVMNRRRARLPIFRGLMIALDVSDPDLVLRGTFAGKTVVIVDRPRAHNYVTAKYAKFQRVTLPAGTLAERCEAFTTNEREAQRLLTPDLLNGLLSLSDAVRGAHRQTRHTDDRIAYTIAGLANGLADAIAALAAGVISWFSTGRFDGHATRRQLREAERTIAPDARGLNEAVHCAFYDDKVLITIPYRYNLFEPDPIFHPPLNDEDIQLAFQLMTQIDGIAKASVAALPRLEE